MKYRSHDAQRDGNEKPIVEALQAIGASVRRLDQPVDLLVGFRGTNYLIEVKLPLGKRGGKAHSKLNTDQQTFFHIWRGQVDEVRNVAEALAVLGVEESDETDL